ncbi:hypothetical protein OJF2_00370 [Aquisphaera giovannonii]|uniref:DUF1737 domain-containing protein n=1 Tax=Aquisphaera giovannonii TaxID=406548 RepID=A0A5B9VTE5_9BACT|nr:hypothetical protein [Aquisphaera giovannonii]QEH31572.1 hypothetical protein OJF2_00370 [Aquisphaera giovannonii]
MQYSVVNTTNLDELIGVVGRSLGEGWVLSGGIAVCVIGDATWYFQAMTHP